MTLGEDLLIALSLNDMRRPAWNHKKMQPSLPHPEGKGIITHLFSNKAPRLEHRAECTRAVVKQSSIKSHILAAGCSRRTPTFSA